MSALNVAPARALLAEGRLEECAREISRLIASKPAWPKGSLIGSVQGLLAARGWTIAVASPRGKVVLAVRRMEDESVLGAYILEYRAALDWARSVSVPALFQLRRLPGSAGTRLSAEEKPELENLSTGLCLLFESLRGRSGGGTGLIVQAETHEAGREGLERILRITSACNHRCPFCFVPVNAGGADRAELERELDALAPVLGPHGTVVISGGEPTVDPRLVDIIASARRRGLRRFVLQTNGAALVRPGLMESLLALGVEGFDVSFHAHKPSSHARITGNRDTFPKVVEGLGRLLDSGRCRVTACVLVNAWNYRELPQLVGFLGKLSRERLKKGTGRLEVAFSFMNGAGMNTAARMAVDLKKAAPYLQRALARCHQEGLVAQRFTGETAMPPCLVADSAAYAGDIEFSQERVRYAEDFRGETGNVGRAKSPSCRKCVYDLRCMGVPAEYARRFGLGALSCRTK